MSIAAVGGWKTVHDLSTGWVHVHRDEVLDDEQVVVTTGTVLGLAAGRLNSVWLQPVFVD